MMARVRGLNAILYGPVAQISARRFKMLLGMVRPNTVAGLCSSDFRTLEVEATAADTVSYYAGNAAPVPSLGHPSTCM